MFITFSATCSIKLQMQRRIILNSLGLLWETVMVSTFILLANCSGNNQHQLEGF